MTTPPEGDGSGSGRRRHEGWGIVSRQQGDGIGERAGGRQRGEILDRVTRMQVGRRQGDRELFHGVQFLELADVSIRAEHTKKQATARRPRPAA